MRRLLSSFALAALSAASANAQASGSEGALFLLLPTGAQAVGIGQASVANQSGSEGIWWNPASIGLDGKSELALQYSQTVAGTGTAIAYVRPAFARAVIGLSATLLDLGSQQITDEFGTPVGAIFPRDVSLGLTFASAIGQRLMSGMTYKVIQLRVDCSGQCAAVGSDVQTLNAVDLGTQYAIIAKHLTVGAAIRNLGGRLNSVQTNRDNPLPTQTDLGASVRFGIDRYLPQTELMVGGGVVDSRSFGGKAGRVGAEIVYQKVVRLRGGYVGHDRQRQASESLGFGVQSGSLIFDIARIFGGLPTDKGQQPTYISLRYLF
jgi:hypothetical protein